MRSAHPNILAACIACCALLQHSTAAASQFVCAALPGSLSCCVQCPHIKSVVEVWLKAGSGLQPTGPGGALAPKRPGPADYSLSSSCLPYEQQQHHYQQQHSISSGCKAVDRIVLHSSRVTQHQHEQQHQLQPAPP
jgi:hypothetical protein